MRRALLLGLLLICAAGVPADGRARADSIAGATEQVIGSTDFSAWRQAAQEAGLPGDAVEMIRALAAGDMPLNGENLAAAVRSLALGEARSMSQWLLLFIAPALLWALNRSVLSEGHMGEAAGFVCYLAGAGLMLGAFSGWMEEAREAVGRLNRMTGQLFPALLALLNSAGKPGTAGIVQTLTGFLSGGVTGFAERVMTVLGGGAAALAVAGNMTERVPLSGLQRLVCTAGGWILGGLMTLFLGAASLGGLTGAAQDGMTVRAARYAADHLLPFVGGDIADTVDAMAFGAVMVKNAAGVTGMVIVAAACLRPVLHLALGALVCRLAAALTEPVADGPLRRCMAQMGQAAQLLLASVAVCAALFMVLLGVVISAGSAALG